MGNPLDSSSYVRLMDKRLREVSENRYAELPKMRDTFFNVVNSDSAWEEFYSIGALPDIPEFTGKLTYLGISPGYHVKIEPKEFAGGVQSERKLHDDKKYPVLDNIARNLGESCDRVQEKSAVRLFTNSNSVAFDFMANEEGVSLCSSSHTTKSGTSTTTGFDNSGTSALSKTSVAATRIAMRQFRNDISERIEAGTKLALVVPTNLLDTAREITETPKGLDTVEGNINPLYNALQVIEYPRLDDTDSNNWWMVDFDKIKEAFVWLSRIMPEFKNVVDFETFTMKHSAYMRFAWGWKEWRTIYGQFVS